MTEQDKNLSTKINRLLDKRPNKEQVPSVFLLALRDWDRGFLQLKRRAFFEMAPLKTRWGFFILVLMLADYKTGVLKISWKDLVAITGFARENIYKILKYLDKKGYINYLPAKNKHRPQIIVKVPDYRKFISKPNSCSDEISLQTSGCRDKSSQEGSGCSDIKSPQALANAGKSKAYEPLNNIYLNNNSTTNAVADSELLERQKTLLECNAVYREDTINNIQALFKEKAKADIARDLIFGRPNSILERFLVENVFANIKRLRWSADIDNPIGLLIKSLENKYELPSSEEERQEQERQRREKEQEDFKKRMLEYKKERSDYSYAKSFIDKMRLAVTRVKVVFLAFLIIACAGYADEVLPLEELKAAALKNNLSLQVKEKEMKSIQSQSSLFNNMKATSSYNFETNTTFYGITMSVPFGFFSDRRKFLSYKKAGLEQARQDLLGEVERLYFEHEVLSKHIAAAYASFKKARLEYTIAKEEFQHGRIEKAKLLEFEKIFKAVEFDFFKARHDARIAKHNLYKLAGIKDVKTS